MSLSAIKDVYTAILEKTEFKEYSSYITALTDNFMQAPDSEAFIRSQYDIISGDSSHIATKEDEIMIVVDKDTTLTDLLLAQLGYYSQDEFFNIVYRVTNNDRYDASLDKHQFDYNSLIGKSFTYYPNNTIFTKTDSASPLATINPFTYSAYEDASWTTGKTLKVTAILRPKENINYGCLTSGFYYTPALTKSILASSKESEIVTYLIDRDSQSFGVGDNGRYTYIPYTYSYSFEDVDYPNQTGMVGKMNAMLSMMGTNLKTLSLRDLGGVDLPSDIAVYPKDFEWKDKVTAYLDTWNNEGDIVIGEKILTFEDRDEVVYTDNLSIIINMINTMIQMVTTALVAFTALSLVVSTVMIAIITYVSVMERVKEIGVIRSLGGRKKDVSRLFNAEAFIIGGVSGLIGIGVTYLLCGILNLIVGSLVGIYTIGNLTIGVAVVMVLISILLTSISGLLPARAAAKKDPVDALRSE